MVVFPIMTTITKKKYGRTYHLPWSAELTSDDKRHSLAEIKEMFLGKEVVVTEKLDGENTTIYSDGSFHARSLDSTMHPSRTLVSALADRIRYSGLPEGWRICGENLQARHSIFYDKLPDTFVVFNVVDELDACLPWKEVVEWACLLDLYTVPVLETFTFEEKHLKGEKFWEKYLEQPSAFSTENKPEGYVVRPTSSYHMSDISDKISKYVRRGHVTTSTHWRNEKIIPNRLAK